MLKRRIWTMGVVCVQGVLLLAMAGCNGDSSSSASVRVEPSASTLTVRATQQFTATVHGLDNTAVIWTAPDGGSISVTGLFTAPDTPGIYRVITTSIADSSVSGTATVTVEAWDAEVGVE